MPKISFFTLLLPLLFCGSLLLHAQDSTAFNPGRAEYLWPTNASNALSGVFAETRTGHFHAALDIKTWGQRGYPVYATRAGKLHRMAIGPTGYGKVLYLKHDDGSYSIYAHLLRFNEQLRQWTDSIRLSRNINSFDMVVDSLDIQFEQGEQIALSGATGIGPPHLHFELRTPNQEPFNPLLTNLEIEDTISPTFSGLAVLPLSIDSKIEGVNRIYAKSPNRGSVYADFGTTNTSGPVGLAVDLFDQANGVHNVYAAYEISMQIDGQEVFHSRMDQFSYQETNQLNIDRVYPLLQSASKGYQRLYLADGNTLPFYGTSGNAGRLNLSPGLHTIRIEAKDFYGNTRQAQVKLNVTESEASAVSAEQPFRKPQFSEIDPNRWTWFNDWVNIPVDDFQQLVLTPLMSSPTRPIYFDNGQTVSVDLSRSPQFFIRTSPTDFFISRRVLPNEHNYLVTPNSNAYASFKPGTFYDTTSVTITKQKTAAGSVEINLFPDNQPIDQDFNLRVRLDSVQLADSTLSVYKTYPGSRYLRKMNTHKSGEYLKATLPSMGRYMILPDTTAPRIRTPYIVKSPDNFWLVHIPAYDRRSGIDYNHTKLYVNGQRGITEYEPEDGRLVYYHPDFEPKSTNRVKIIAYDKIGNRTVKEVSISQ